jgi:RNA recognition motif-containing protein
MHTVIVFNISGDVTEGQLQELFLEYGEVQYIKFASRRNYALITFEGENDARRAVEAGGKELSGRKLTVRMAKWDV